MAEIPVVTTDRLVLRGWEPGDIDRYAAMCADPEVMRYLGAGKPLSRAEVEKRVRSDFVEEWDHWGQGHWVVATRDNNDFIGYCALLLWKEGTPEATPEVAYGFARSAWGKGLATEAARAAIQWGMDRFDWTSVAGLTHPDNVASQQVLTKLGMTFTGQWDGPFYRMNVYEAAREEFLAS